MPQNTPHIALDTVLAVTSEQVHRRVADELLVLDVARGRYYSLNAVASRIWQLLQQPVQARAILDTLTQEFDVERDQAAEDLLQHLQQLVHEGLVEVVTR